MAPQQSRIMLNKLKEIGFKKVGMWHLNNGKPQLTLHDATNASDILYCFVVDGIPKYIGKTTQTLAKRMYGYYNPSSSQRTNIRNNQNLQRALHEGKQVDLFVLTDKKLLKLGDFHINIAAGLEDSLISTLSPEWNLLGK